MNRNPTAKSVTIPQKAVLSPLTRRRATVALTRREVALILASQNGLRARDIDAILVALDEGNIDSVCLSNGAKVQPASFLTHKPPTRARTYLLTGCDYAGDDVAALVTVAA